MPTSEPSFEDQLFTHQPALMRYLRFLGAEEDAACEVAQDAFVAVLNAKARGKFVAGSEAESFAYLRTSARNAYFGRLRKKAPEARAEIEVLDQAWDRLSSKGLQEDRLARLAACRHELAERAAEVIRMQYEEGRSVAEIADALNTSSDAVASLLKRARVSLRECMEKYDA